MTDLLQELTALKDLAALKAQEASKAQAQLDVIDARLEAIKAEMQALDCSTANDLEALIARTTAELQETITSAREALSKT